MTGPPVWCWERNKQDIKQRLVRERQTICGPVMLRSSVFSPSIDKVNGQPAYSDDSHPMGPRCWNIPYLGCTVLCSYTGTLFNVHELPPFLSAPLPTLFSFPLHSLLGDCSVHPPCSPERFVATCLWLWPTNEPEAWQGSVCLCVIIHLILASVTHLSCQVLIMNLSQTQAPSQ